VNYALPSPLPDWYVKNELNPQEYTFIEEYFVSLNKSAAARAAGHSPSYADKIMRRPHVAAAMEQILHERSTTRNWIVDELIQKVTANLADFFEDDGRTLKNIKELPRELSGVVVGFEFDKFGNRNIKIIDKLGALTLLSKLLGMHTNKTEISGPKGAPIEVSEVDPRVTMMERLAEIKAKQQQEV